MDTNTINKESKQLDDANKTLKEILNDSGNPKKDKFKNLGTNINQIAKLFKKEIDKSKGKSVKYAKYKYGSLVMVNFGMNVGDELCGNHFAIVLTNDDSPYSSMLTVLPLSSKNKSNRLSLGEIITNDIQNKIIKSTKEIEEVSVEQMESFTDSIVGFLKIVQKYASIKTIKEFNEMSKDAVQQTINAMSREDLVLFQKYNDDLKLASEISKNIINNLNKLRKTMLLYSSKNSITYAIIDQIQSISKFKVLKPINEYDPISNLLIDANVMLNIENKIVSRFFTKAKRMVDKTKKEC